MANEEKELYKFVNDPKYRSKVIAKIHKNSDNAYNKRIKKIEHERDALSKKLSLIHISHATFHRGIGSYTFCYEDEKTYGTLTNMMGVILVTLYHKGQREVWNNTEILNGVGRIEAKDQQIQSVFGNELIQDVYKRQLSFSI